MADQLSEKVYRLLVRPSVREQRRGWVELRPMLPIAALERLEAVDRALSGKFLRKETHDAFIRLGIWLEGWEAGRESAREYTVGDRRRLESRIRDLQTALRLAISLIDDGKGVNLDGLREVLRG